MTSGLHESSELLRELQGVSDQMKSNAVMHSWKDDCHIYNRITDQRHEKLPYFLFGDFNFRLDSKQVIEVRKV
ncbi:inositol polyphosphate-5-phosphatase A [Tachysurus ichikawai]